MPQLALGARDRQPPSVFLKDSLHGNRFCFVAQWSARAMSVDIIDGIGIDARISQPPSSLPAPHHGPPRQAE